MIEIDLVIPMVFPQDEEWKRTFARYHGGEACSNVRWRSWGTEELLVKCCQKYMPWVRKIHLLLASESQLRFGLDGINGDDKPIVTFVFHREFIPEEHLPCFSSPCIEMFLHRIPGLAEHFIYANDDMFPLSPLESTDFFRRPTPNPPCEGGSRYLFPCQKIVEKPYPVTPNIFHKACLEGLNMVAAPFGKHYTKTYLKNGHSFAPYLKSTCEEVWRRHGEQILKHLSPLKRRSDSYNQYLYAYYQHLAGLEIPHAPREQYVGKNTPTERLAAIIRDPQAGIVCLNDNESIKDWEKRAEVVRQEIKEKLITA